MFSITMLDFETQQKELHRRATNYRLILSIKKSNSWLSKMTTSFGMYLIDLGYQIINRYQSQSQPI
jgi:hypothetical protein